MHWWDDLLADIPKRQSKLEANSTWGGLLMNPLKTTKNLGAHRFLHAPISVAVLADISLRSPRKLFIYDHKIYV